MFVPLAVQYMHVSSLQYHVAGAIASILVSVYTEFHFNDTSPFSLVSASSGGATAAQAYVVEPYTYNNATATVMQAEPVGRPVQGTVTLFCALSVWRNNVVRVSFYMS
jgi:hypothetical protein